jgi:hypothetical protein
MKTLTLLVAMLAVASITKAQTLKLPNSDTRPKSPSGVDAPTTTIQEQERVKKTLPDLKAEKIDFSVVNPRGTEADAKIVGIIINNSTRKYMSSEGYQSIKLFEGYNGRPSKLLATLPFKDLDAGQRLEIIYNRHWSATKMTEFIPDYILVIEYNEKLIAKDGNPDNDDINSTNNRISRNGQWITDTIIAASR